MNEKNGIEIKKRRKEKVRSGIRQRKGIKGESLVTIIAKKEKLKNVEF